MILQVHDELVFEVAEEDAEALRVLVKTRMEAAAELRVPLTVETGIGPNRDVAHRGSHAPINGLARIFLAKPPRTPSL